ncbi:ABC transporter substrate-binding protein [Nocardia sp. NBC_00511]|uniref:ABC transporter substrate-binding protein n=1 Tax=Nocardia sp. NBC_00511 TaxID=2903591 RepID=UPI0030E3A22B
MLPETSPRIGRRSMLLGMSMAGLAALTGCARNDDPAEGQGDAWRYTDDRGVELGLAARPSRIVAFTGSAAVLADYGLQDRLVGVFGDATTASGARSELAGNLDLGRVRVLGNRWGEFDVERYAMLEPDLLVTDTYGDGALWYVPDDRKTKLLTVNPNVVAIAAAHRSMPLTIERYAQLAQGLGADLGAPAMVSDRDRFEAASSAVRAAATANPGVRVLAASGAPNLLYIADPRISSDLGYFRELGVNIVVPDKVDAGGTFEALSWENADKYQADLILLDDRSTALQSDALAANPVWRSLPAVRDNRITPWSPVYRFSHPGTTPLLERLATALRPAT